MLVHGLFVFVVDGLYGFVQLRDRPRYDLRISHVREERCHHVGPVFVGDARVGAYRADVLAVHVIECGETRREKEKLHLVGYIEVHDGREY